MSFMSAKRTLLRSLWLMNQGPLAVGVGAGAGGLSTALLTALLGHFRESPSDPFVCPNPPFAEPPLRPDFYFGLALGVLLGIATGALLDLIYLARQHLTVSLRNRLASLTLTRPRCG